MEHALRVGFAIVMAREYLTIFTRLLINAQWSAAFAWFTSILWIHTMATLARQWHAA